MKRGLSLLLVALMLCPLFVACMTSPATSEAEDKIPAAAEAVAVPVVEAPAAEPVSEPAVHRDSFEINEKYLDYRYQISLDATCESLDAALAVIGCEAVLGKSGAVETSDLMWACIAAAGLTELALTYSEEKADARLAHYGLAAVGNAALFACALDAGLLSAAEANALLAKDVPTREDIVNLFSVAIELGGKGRNYLGYSDDADIVARIYNRWESIARYDDAELSEVGLQMLFQRITTGYNLQFDGYQSHFLPELTMRYGQDDIQHAAQFIALLNSEDMLVKLQIVPKISVYEYMLEWGPIPEATLYYEVKPVGDRWFVYAFEYDVQMEFTSREEMLRFNSIVLSYAKKNEGNEDGKGLIYASWWQPLYTTDENNDMPEGNKEYKRIGEAVVTNGSGYSVHSGILAEDIDRVREQTTALNANCVCEPIEVWGDAAFYRYLTGEDYQ